MVQLVLGGLAVLGILWGAINIVSPVFVGTTQEVQRMEFAKPFSQMYTEAWNSVSGAWASQTRKAEAAPSAQPVPPATQPARVAQAVPSSRGVCLDGEAGTYGQYIGGRLFEVTRKPYPNCGYLVKPADSQTPAPPAEQPASSSTTCPESRIEAGQVRLVQAGCTVVGDVQVSESQSGGFKKLHDDDPSTGLVVKLNRDAFVRAPWGASISGRSASQIASEMRVSGCGSSCRLVEEKVW